LKNVLGNRNFDWNFLPVNGIVGGILVGVNSDVFDDFSWEVKKFSFSTIVKIKSYMVNIRLTTVYGSPYEEGKDAFILELHEFFFELGWSWHDCGKL
jgi:hypothetical protein